MTDARTLLRGYNQAMPIITLTTDFGTQDHYVAAMKAVILGICPGATLVDVTHEVPPQDVYAGAFALQGAAPYFPAGTVHLAVVDPGVGSARRPLAVQAGTHYLVGPDNGLLPLAAAAIVRERLHVVHMTKRQYWRPDVSSTFHGRDIFAPVAAHLALGVSLYDLGNAVGDYVQLHIPDVLEANGVLVGEILHIDRFGNCISNVPAARVPRLARITLGGRTLAGVRAAYTEVQRGELLALISSGGFVEIAVRDGSAARLLGARVGDAVRVE